MSILLQTAIGFFIVGTVWLIVATIWRDIFLRREALKKEISLDEAFASVKPFLTITLMFFQGVIFLFTSATLFLIWVF